MWVGWVSGVGGWVGGLWVWIGLGGRVYTPAPLLHADVYCCISWVGWWVGGQVGAHTLIE